MEYTAAMKVQVGSLAISLDLQIKIHLGSSWVSRSLSQRSGTLHNAQVSSSAASLDNLEAAEEQPPSPVAVPELLKHPASGKTTPPDTNTASDHKVPLHNPPLNKVLPCWAVEMGASLCSLLRSP